MWLHQNLVSTSAAAIATDDDDNEDDEVFSRSRATMVRKLLCPIQGCIHGEFKTVKTAINFAKHILQQHFNY